MTCHGCGTIPRLLPEIRKRILRTVLKEIVVTIEGDRLRLMVHWQGGDHTRLEVVKNRIGQNRFKTDMETVQLVCELARLLPDHSIAPVLNRLGIRSARGHGWTQLSVRNFRGAHQIAVYREGERAQRHELILHEAASRLGINKMTVIRLDPGRDTAWKTGLCWGAVCDPRRRSRSASGASSNPRMAALYHPTRDRKVCPFNKFTR